MGDPRRFNLFAELISELLPNNLKIIDAAAGKGILQSSLKERGFDNIISYDKRNRRHKNLNYRYGYFNFLTEDRADAIIAMHPDEATDHSILFAAKHRIPGIICPCCTKPSAQQYWGNHKYQNWLKHLINLAEENDLKVELKKLKMNGRNDVLVLKP